MDDAEMRVLQDAWIYNVAETPEEWPWDLPGATADDAPFANPRYFVDETDERPTIRSDGSNLSSDWHLTESRLDYVDVLVDGVVFARLAPESSPGWARLASRTGPTAKPLGDYGRL